MAVALAWWNMVISHDKSLPEKSAGHEEKDQVILNQPKDRVDDFAAYRANSHEVEMSEPGEGDRIKSIRQDGAQVGSVAAIEPLPPIAVIQNAHRLPDVESGSIAQSNEQPQAVRLADDFELPAAMMHMAAMKAGQEGAGMLTAPVKAAVDHLVDEFYRDVSKAGEPEPNANSQTAELSQDQSNFNTDEESGEMTRVIEPTDGSLQSTEIANRSHQLLFGDEAANRFGIQSKLEVKLPVDGQE